MSPTACISSAPKPWPIWPVSEEVMPHQSRDPDKSPLETAHMTPRAGTATCPPEERNLMREESPMPAQTAPCEHCWKMFPVTQLRHHGMGRRQYCSGCHAQMNTHDAPRPQRSRTAMEILLDTTDEPFDETCADIDGHH